MCVPHGPEAADNEYDDSRDPEINKVFMQLAKRSIDTKFISHS